MLKKYIASWFLFLLTGGIMAYCRYGEGLAPENFERLKAVAPYVVLGIHLCIVYIAYQDTYTQFLLALCVPVYSFYYLLFICENPYIKALLAGVLVGTIQDALIFYQQELNEFIRAGHSWMDSGAGIYD